MKKTLALVALFGALAVPAWASGYHRGPHDGPVLHAGAMAIGHPGDPALVDRTIRMSMIDAPTGAMAFDVQSIEIRQGETIRLVLSNDGGAAHEFVMATPAEIAVHRAEMGDAAGMIHEAAYAARVDPGATRTLVWTFTNGGSFEFACLIPGHYEAGMRGRLTVE